MLFNFILITWTILSFVITDTTPLPKEPSVPNTKPNNDAHNVFSSYVARKTLPKKVVYFDPEVTEFRVPGHRNIVKKKKLLKKSPKRTIQKIIKKNKSKKKYFSQVTSAPTIITEESFEYKNEQQETIVESTTQMIQKKMMKKWKANEVRLPNPFHRFKKDQSVKYRLKRENLRRKPHAGRPHNMIKPQRNSKLEKQAKRQRNNGGVLGKRSKKLKRDKTNRLKREISDSLEEEVVRLKRFNDEVLNEDVTNIMLRYTVDNLNADMGNRIKREIEVNKRLNNDIGQLILDTVDRFRRDVNGEVSKIDERLKRDTNGDVSKIDDTIDRAFFILQDLDEVEFMSGENGTSKLLAHVKHYW